MNRGLQTWTADVFVPEKTALKTWNAKYKFEFNLQTLNTVRNIITGTVTVTFSSLQPKFVYLDYLLFEA